MVIILNKKELEYEIARLVSDLRKLCTDDYIIQYIKTTRTKK